MATTTNYGWETPDDTDLVKDGAAAIRTLGNGIDTSLIDLKGGTTGQNLRKASNTDLDFTFAGDATNTVVDAAGDLLYGTANDTLGRLAIGTAGQVLKVNSGATAPEWGAAASSGLTLITRQPYSAASAVNVNDVFSATYDNYLVIFKNTAGTAGATFNMRLRVSGADNSTTNYFSGGAESTSGGLTNRFAGSQNAWFNQINIDLTTSFQATFFSPFLTQKTAITALETHDTGARHLFYNGFFNDTTSFTGFSFFPASSTITGEVAVYGYAR